MLQAEEVAVQAGMAAVTQVGGVARSTNISHNVWSSGTRWLGMGRIVCRTGCGDRKAGRAIAMVASRECRQ